MTQDQHPMEKTNSAVVRQQRYRDRREKEGLTMVRVWVPTQLANELRAVGFAMRHDLQGKPPTQKQIYDLGQLLKRNPRLYSPSSAIKSDQWRLSMWLAMHGR
jgi:hypothetical protein